MKIRELQRRLNELLQDETEEIFVGFSYKDNGAFVLDIRPRICDDGEGNAFLDIGKIDQWIEQENKNE